MTRKDYELIAAALAAANMDPGYAAQNTSAFNRGYDTGRKAAAQQLARYLADANPKFDSARFLKAAGAA